MCAWKGLQAPDDSDQVQALEDGNHVQALEDDAHVKAFQERDDEQDLEDGNRFMRMGPT